MLTKKKIFLSIIIPCYNNEKFIKTCLSSVSIEKSGLIEIIIINDGSKDQSLKIIKNYINKKKISNFTKVITQKNHGLGYARNIGIKNAKGKYITFLDSDDLFINKFVNKILKIIQLYNYDIIEFGFFRFNYSIQEGLKTYKPIYSFEGFYLMKDVLLDIFSKTVWYASTRIYKKKLWNNIKFPDNFFYEDHMTIYKIFLKAKSIFFIKKPFLAYRFNKNSITSNLSRKHLNDLITFYFTLKNNNIFLKIMRLRTARTISYMRYKLNIDILDYIKVKNLISRMKLNFKTLIKLRIADIFYYLSPNFYDRINKFRLNK